MKIYCIFFLISGLFFNGQSQQMGNWQLLNEGMQIDQIDFVSDNTGWILNRDGFYKTLDGADSWEFLAQPKNITFDMIDFITDSTAWAIGSSSPIGNYHIYKSQDAGFSWQESVLLPANADRYYISGITDSVAYVSGYLWQGPAGNTHPQPFVIKTGNGGKQWTDISPSYQDRYLYEIKLANDKTALALGRVGDNRDGNYRNHEVSILRTGDGGTTWDEIILPDFGESDLTYGMQYLTESNVYFLARKFINDSSKFFIYGSSDSGKTWSTVMENNNMINSFHFRDALTGYALVRESQGGTVLTKTVDGGQTWQNDHIFGFGADKIFITESNTGFVWRTGWTNNCLWKTTDSGQSWIKKIFTLALNHIYFVNSMHGYACGYDYGVSSHFAWYSCDIFETIDGNKTWKHVNNTQRFISSIAFLNEQTGFKTIRGSIGTRGYANGEIQKTTDSGKRWYSVYRPTIDSAGYWTFINDLIMSNQSTGWAAGRFHGDSDSAGGAAIFGTIDGGDSWLPVWKFEDTDEYHNELFSVHTAGATVWAVGLAGASGNLIVKYMGPDSVKITKGIGDLPLHKIFFSDEKNGWIISSNYVDSGPFWGRLPSSLYKTKDAGQVWKGMNFTSVLVRDLFFENKLRGWAVGADTSGRGCIIASNDGGQNWWYQVTGLSSILNTINYKDGILWAAGENGLILKTLNSAEIDTTYKVAVIAGDITDLNDKKPEALPFTSKLQQNYPNPFNPVTNIEYTVRAQNSVPQHVNLSIYNILGQKVATLVNKKQAAGSYNVQWDAVNMTSGIYIYCLQAGDVHNVKKMVLIR